MKLNAFSPIPENEEELHLPELVYWSSLGDVAQVKSILEQGVDVNSTDEDGYSALQAAAENNYLDVVKLLVSHHADIHLKGQYTALELAEMAGNQQIVDYLKSLNEPR